MRDIFFFWIGWILLCALGSLLMVVSLPRIALIATASIGIIAAIKGFRGFEMLLMMIVASVLGGLLNSTTDWAWIAPFLPAGFMLSVALENAIREKS